MSGWTTPESGLPWAARHLTAERWDETLFPDGLEEVMGPTDAHLLGVPFDSITHGGLKRQGEAYSGPLIWNEAEAWACFYDFLRRYLKGATQIVWRSLPESEQDPKVGNWIVTSRLTRWPLPEEGKQ